MNCHKNFYIQQFQLQGSLIDGQSVGEMNPCILSSVFLWFKIWTIAAKFWGFRCHVAGDSFFWDMKFV